jgi:hypothetical protein
MSCKNCLGKNKSYNTISYKLLSKALDNIDTLIFCTESKKTNMIKCRDLDPYFNTKNLFNAYYDGHYKYCQKLYYNNDKNLLLQIENFKILQNE